MQIVKLHIDGNIGDKDPMLQAMGIEESTISSTDVANFISQNADAEVFEVEIRSNGGSVSHGFDIYDQLKASGKKIITKGYRVNSIATIIFLAGDERYLSKNAEFIIHNPWIGSESLQGMSLTADTLEEISNDVRQSEEKIYNFYSKFLRLNDSDRIELKGLMDKDTDIGSELALQWGFATGLIEDYKKKYKRSSSNAVYTDMILAKYKSKIETQMENKQVSEQITGLEKAVNKLMAFFKRNIKNAVATLQDGTSVYFEGESLEIGSTLWLDEEFTSPVPDAEHVLNDGTIVVTKDGIVTEIRPAEATTEIEIEVGSEEVENLKKENETLKAEIENLKSAHTKEVEEIAFEIKNLQKELNTFKGVVAGDKRKDKQAKVVSTQTNNEQPWKSRLNKERESRNKF